MTGLEVSHLRKSYGDTVVVHDLSFRVAQGEVFGLIGPNGAGKSTSMNMIIGLLKADGGSVSFDGQPYDHHNPEMRSWFGIVPQNLAIYPQLSAIQNLKFFGGLNGLRGRKLKERVDFVLNVTGLTANAHQDPSTFSGGMSRRLNFGIALLHEPKFVVLDEPTVGIDPQSRSNLLDSVRKLADHGVGVLYASHYMEEVEAVCSRVGIIDHGRLLKEGTLDELLDRTGRDLCLNVDTLPVEVAERVKDFAEIRKHDDGEQDLVIRDERDGKKNGSSANLRAVLDILDDASVTVTNIETHEISLETLFLSLTGRKLRD